MQQFSAVNTQYLCFLEQSKLLPQCNDTKLKKLERIMIARLFVSASFLSLTLITWSTNVSAQLALKDEQTRCLQQLLQKTDYLVDDVSGIFNSETRHALNRYMKAANYEQYALQPDQAATPTKIKHWIALIIASNPELGTINDCLQTESVFAPTNSR